MSCSLSYILTKLFLISSHFNKPLVLLYLHLSLRERNSKSPIINQGRDVQNYHSSVTKLTPYVRWCHMNHLICTGKVNKPTHGLKKSQNRDNPDWRFKNMEVRERGVHTEKSFRNFIKSTRNQIVFTIFRLIWIQTDVTESIERWINSKHCFELTHLSMDFITSVWF